MPFINTALPGAVIFEPRILEDERGFFFEAYNEQVFAKEGISARFIQDNQSFSTHGVIRGLHYQLEPFAQAKLVRVLRGNILDVIVDIRRNSPAYGQHFSVELSAQNKKQLFVPRGFAHGFSVLSDEAEVLYKCDNIYHRDSEGGIAYNDPALEIDWKIPAAKAIVSAKDRLLPGLASCQNNFEYRLKTAE